MNEVDPQFEALLISIREARGFDFTGYKRSSLVRRFGRRMAEVGIEGYAEYQDYLELHPDEFTALFNTILINVTGFFRDPDSWEFLQNGVVGPLLHGRPNDMPIRVWSAGCASGEEAYTLAEGHETNPRSIWGYVQGLTRLSQRTPWQDGRFALDRAASRLLTTVH